MCLKEVRSFSLLKKLIIFGFIIYACSKSLIIAPIKASGSSADFAPIYSSASAWVKGINPYLQELSKGKNFPSVYPLNTFILISPLTVVSWPYAKVIWMVINIVVLIALLASMVILAGFPLTSYEALLLIISSLALTPIQSCIVMGQPTIIAIAFGIWSIWLSRYKYDIFSGILLAFGLSLKIHCAIPFMIYYVFRRRWNILAISTCVMVVIFTIGVLRLGLNDFSWLLSWQENLKSSFLPGGINDPSGANPIRYELLNLHFPLAILIKDQTIVNAIVIIITSIALLIFGKLTKLTYNFYDDILLLSALSIISLLSTYHRGYDAAILIIPITLIIVMLNNEYRHYIRLIVLTIIPFYIYGLGTLVKMARNGIIPSKFVGTWYWNILITHRVWSLLILSSILIYLMIIRKRATNMIDA